MDHVGKVGTQAMLVTNMSAIFGLLGEVLTPATLGME